jgi:hypothetical protein
MKVKSNLIKSAGPGVDAQAGKLAYNSLLMVLERAAGF